MSEAVREPAGVRGFAEAFGVTLSVTAAVTVASALLPDRYIATAVAFVFLAATWATVWRRDDAHVEACGLALGGVVLPGKLDGRRIARAVGRSLLWAAIFAAITFVPFFFGWRHYWRPHGAFGLRIFPLDLANEAFGQLVIIALPEEAFYRGYLQSRLDAVFPKKINVLGARVGVSLLVTSALFAAGHFATIREPSRLAVFFPSLLFGWLRARTGGIGAGVTYHASCNVFSELLGKGFRVY
ncbi:MAG: CPBP family intramembrane metalloprotease [Myxococcales bacterium]|nr:CPBP family intramembrane metalloprotease [Myxococcales bacterium]